MRIISQNRSVSVNFDNIHILLDGEMIFFRDVCQQHDTKSVLLGRYVTGNRAQEVFNELHERYTPVISQANIPIQNYIYYMPEK